METGNLCWDSRHVLDQGLNSSCLDFNSKMFANLTHYKTERWMWVVKGGQWGEN